MLIPLMQASLLPDWVIISATLLGILLIILGRLVPFLKSYQVICHLIVAIIFGFAWFSLNAHQSLAESLPRNLENIPLIAQGKIDSLPVTKYGQIQFQFTVEKLCQDNQCQFIHLETLLNWQHAPNNLVIGQTWQLKIKLKRPHGYANPGSFDREAWLFENGIRATGYVITPFSMPSSMQHDYQSASSIKCISDEEGVCNTSLRNSIWNYLTNIRLRYDRFILNTLINRPFAGVIDALTVGNSAAISQPQWQVFRNTGTTHLIAISGLHIGMIAALFYFTAGWLWRRFATLCEMLPSQKAAAIFAIVGALVYTAFSGFSIPAQRTLIMIIAWMSSILVSRYSLPMQRFMLGLGIILIINPFAVMNMGFWLSFGAIALIGYGMNARLAATNLWWRFGRVQWVATIGLMPLSWLLFQQTSVVGLLANMIAIPWVGWVTVPIALLGCIIAPFNHQIAYWLLLLSEKTLEWLWPYLQYLANIHWNSWFLGLNNPWLIIPCMVAVLLLLAPTRFPGRWLAIIWFFPVIAVKPEKLPSHSVKITTLDVGQGLAVVIQTHSHTAIYDTGMGYPDGYNMGDIVILPFLRNQHIYHIDQLIISHGDADHAGGAMALLQQYPSLPILTSATGKFKGYHVEACVVGQQWQWDGVQFKMLYPFPEQKQADNNTSCVLQIQAGDKSILLPGDIEKPAEYALLSKYQHQLKSTLLVAPHHGSISSSTPKFLAAVQPQYVIFATGYLNRYRFPSKIVEQRYQQEGSQCFNSAYGGAVTVILRPNKPVELQQYRVMFHHFWQ
jgi:competence protein ComEC